MTLDGGDCAPSPGTTPSPQTPRSLFAQRLTDLFTAAGNPTLERVAAATDRRLRPSQGRDGGKPVSFKRISDWRAGRNVPARFETLSPVLVTLIDLARGTGQPVPAPLFDLRQWHTLWKAAVAWRLDTLDPEASCPYRGLAPYGTEHATWFFGRTTATTELTERVRSAAAGGGGIVALVGASGAGKSSLLQAGLIPAVTAGIEGWQVATITPGPDPRAALTTAVEGTIGRWSPGKPGLLVIDQFEELFTACTEDTVREQFLTALQELTSADEEPRVVVLGIRADFFARCLDYRVLENALNERAYMLGPMRAHELADAVTGPATLAGLRLEPGLADLVITELRGPADNYDPGALPLLSHVMAATWNHREGRQLTIEGYRKTGGVVGSVAGTAETVWSNLTEPQRAHAQPLLVQLVDVDPDHRDTRRIVTRQSIVDSSEDPGAAGAVLEALVRARLVTLDDRHVLFTHEIVLSAWPRLRAWIEEDRVGYLVQQRLESDAADWAGARRDPALLYRGPRLESAGAAVGRLRLPPTRTGADFLAAARRSARRGRRRTAAIRTVLALLGVGILVLAIGIVAEVRISETRRAAADLETVLAEADAVRTGDPTLSAELDLVAHSINAGDGTVRSRLLATQNLPLATSLPGHGQTVRGIAFQPGGTILATGSTDHTIRLWRTALPNPQQVGTTIDCGAAVSGAAFTPDGATLVAACGTTLRTWSVADPADPRGLATVETGRAVTMMASTTSGGMVAVATDDNAVALWSLESPTAPRLITVLPGTPDPVTALQFVPTRAWLAVAGANTVRLWSVPDGHSGVALGPPITAPDPDIQAIAIDPAGRTLAIGTGTTERRSEGRANAVVSLWDVGDPTQVRQLGQPLTVAHESELRSLAFAPDGESLAAGDHSVVTIWNIANPARIYPLGEPVSISSPPCPIPNTLQPCVDGPTVLSFGADAHTLAVGGDLGSVRIWSLPPAAISGVLGWGARPVLSDNDRLLTAVLDQDAYLWDVRNWHAPRQLADLGPGPSGGWVYSATLNPAGTLAAVPSGSPPTVRVLDIADPASVHELFELPDTAVAWFDGVADSLLFSMPLGDTHALQIWRVTDRTHPVKIGPPVTFDPAPLRAQPDPAQTSQTLWFDAASDTTLITLATDLKADGTVPSAIRFWDFSDPAHMHEIGHIDADPGHPFAAQRSTEDGDLVVLTGDLLQTWDIHDPTNPHKLGPPVATNGLNIQSLEFSPDLDTIVTTSADSSVRLWDYHDRAHPRPIGQSIAPTAPTAWHLNFASADDLIGTRNGAMAIWDLDEQHAIQRICNVTRGALSREVWAAHLQRLAYRPPC
ncbi:hypothetical protein ACFXHA_04110 [Nocardia sp. NPDC059240]|uniref:nSTAND1 domain-containing NTPase n=1 Tax=Nocardia sp. NPDC059240 TaxID=3346786 RepID=UPI00368FD4AE